MSTVRRSAAPSATTWAARTARPSRSRSRSSSEGSPMMPIRTKNRQPSWQVIRRSTLHRSASDPRFRLVLALRAGDPCPPQLRRARGAGATACPRRPLPSDQLHPGRHGHPRLHEDHGRQGRARRRSSASRSSRCGRTGTPATSRPTYYLQTDAPLYYYSFTDAFIAMAYLSLTKEEQARLDPMITGFNPADMYAGGPHPAGAEDLPRRVLRDRRVHDPQGVRLLEDRRRDGEPHRTRRSTGSSTSPARPASS